MAASATRLTTLFGVGPLVAARIMAEVVDVRRYRSTDALPRPTAQRPFRPAADARSVTGSIGAETGSSTRHCRSSPSPSCAGTLKGAATTTVNALLASRREAQRCLKRRLSDVVFHLLREDLVQLEGTQPAATDTSVEAA